MTPNKAPTLQSIHRRIAAVLHMMCVEVQDEENKEMHRPKVDDDEAVVSERRECGKRKEEREIEVDRHRKKARERDRGRGRERDIDRGREREQ